MAFRDRARCAAHSSARRPADVSTTPTTMRSATATSLFASTLPCHPLLARRFVPDKTLRRSGTRARSGFLSGGRLTSRARLLPRERLSRRATRARRHPRDSRHACRMSPETARAPDAAGARQRRGSDGECERAPRGALSCAWRDYSAAASSSRSFSTAAVSRLSASPNFSRSPSVRAAWRSRSACCAFARASACSSVGVGVVGVSPCRDRSPPGRWVRPRHRHRSRRSRRRTACRAPR